LPSGTTPTPRDAGIVVLSDATGRRGPRRVRARQALFEGNPTGSKGSEEKGRARHARSAMFAPRAPARPLRSELDSVSRDFLSTADAREASRDRGYLAVERSTSKLRAQERVPRRLRKRVPSRDTQAMIARRVSRGTDAARKTRAGGGATRLSELISLAGEHAASTGVEPVRG